MDNQPFEMPDSDRLPDDQQPFVMPEKDRIGTMEAAGRGALRNFPLAQQAAAFLEPGKYEENLQNLTNKAEAAKQAHPVAYGAGAVGGSLAPMLIPGVGEALEGAPVAGNAIMGGLQGVSDVALNKPEAIKQGAIGAGIGAGVGGAAGLAGKALGKIGGAVPVEANAPKILPGGAANTLSDVTHVAKELTPPAERIGAEYFARAIGFPPRQFAAYAKQMGENPVQAAIDLEKWGSSKNIVNVFSHPEDLPDVISGIKNNAGKTIGGVIDKFGTEPIPTQTIKDELNSIAWHTIDPPTAAKIERAVERVRDLNAKGWLDWNSLNEIKGMIGKHVKDSPEIAEAYGVVARHMSDMAEATGKRIGDPMLKTAYETAKRDYRMTSLLEPIVRRSATKEMVGGHVSLPKVAADAIEAMTGFPKVGQIGKNILAKSSQVVRNLPKIGAKISPAAQAELTDYLTSQYQK